MRAPRFASGRWLREGHRTFGALGAALILLVARGAAAEAKERAITPGEVESWLDANGQPNVDTQTVDPDAPPPPPPRHQGFVVESTIGAFGQLGEMRHISPLAPWFRLQFGFEPFRWLMVFAEADLVLSNTGYAHPPPPSRSYGLWGFGAGLRGTIKVGDRVGLYLQGSLGAAKVNDDVLGIYGYRHADQLNLYLAGELGVEWYQVSPHFGLALHGGLRDYTATFKREQSNLPPMAWLAGLALRYTF